MVELQGAPSTASSTMPHGYVNLNVGGKYYTTSISTLTSYPGSMLFEIFYQENIPLPMGRYIIDRDGDVFRYILNFLRDGNLNLPPTFQEYDQLYDELEFYQLGEMKELLRFWRTVNVKDIIDRGPDKGHLLHIKVGAMHFIMPYVRVQHGYFEPIRKIMEDKKISDVRVPQKRVVTIDFDPVVNLQGAKDDIARAKANGDTQLFHYMNIQAAWDQSWDDIAWIRSITDLPIILKGIITDENAKEAVAAGVQGIIVSAHGGRQLDGIQAPIEALPEVVDAVRGSGVEVYMDDGVSSGRDIFKALALGAKAVFIGRPAVWGLIHNGTDGIVEIMDMMKEEFINTMSLCGCNSLHELNRSFVKRNNHLACKL